MFYCNNYIKYKKFKENNFTCDDHQNNQYFENLKIQDNKSIYKNFFSKEICLTNNKVNKHLENEKLSVTESKLKNIKPDNLNNIDNINKNNLIDIKYVRGDEETSIVDDKDIKICNLSISNSDNNDLPGYEKKNINLNNYNYIKSYDIKDNISHDKNTNHLNNYPNIKDNFFQSELVSAFFKSINESKEEKKTNKIQLFNQSNKDEDLEKNEDNLEYEFLFDKNRNRINNKNFKMEDEKYYGPKISIEKK